MNKIVKNIIILIVALLSIRFLIGLVGFIFYLLAYLFGLLFNILMFILALALPFVLLIAVIVIIIAMKSGKFENDIQKHIDATRNKIRF